MKLISIQAKNVMRLNAVLVEFKDGLFIVGGDNEQGKSSLISAVEMIFKGCKGNPMPIRKGAKKMEINAVLEGEEGKLFLTLKKSAKSSSLVIKGEDGLPWDSPQKRLNAFYNSMIDPVAFKDFAPKKQREVLMEVMGVDFTNLNKLRTEAFDKRADHNREAKRLEALIEPKGEEVAKVDATALSKSLGAAHENNSKIRDSLSEEQTLENQIQVLTQRANDSEDEIVELEASIEAVKLRIVETKDTIEKQRSKISALVTCRPSKIDTDPIQFKLDHAAKTNAQAEHFKKMTGIGADLAMEKAHSSSLTTHMDDIDEKKIEMLSEAKPPIDDLTFDDDGLMYKGVVFPNLSSSLQLRVCIAMAAATNPHLNLLLVREGSLLDAKHLAVVGEMAEKLGVNIIMERVSKGPECSIIIEDGGVEGAMDLLPTEPHPDDTPDPVPPGFAGGIADEPSDVDVDPSATEEASDEPPVFD